MKQDSVFGAGFMTGALSGVAGVLAIIWFKNKLSQMKLASSTGSETSSNQASMGVRG